MCRENSLVVTGTAKDCWELTRRSVNLKVGKAESWAPGFFFERWALPLHYWGVLAFSSCSTCVCLFSPLARRGGGSHVNKCIYYTVSLGCIYSSFSCASLLEPSVLRSAGLCQQSSVMASVLAADLVWALVFPCSSISELSLSGV